jgi:hypothetical protein
MKTVLYIAAFFAMLTGCDEQRDLYIHGSPHLSIEGDWMPSLGESDMSGRVTAVLYQDGRIALTEYFNTSNRATAEVFAGKYGILMFNGLMFSEKDIKLNQIYFRNTDKAETFEAVAEEADPNLRLVRADGEYLASNNMELLTSAWEEVTIDDENGYLMKYSNGYNCYIDPNEYTNQEVRMTPRRVSYYAQVIVRLANPSSAMVANGALRGFTGSVFMVSGLPSHLRATHQLKLNNLHIDESSSGDTKTGTIESPVFVTFGPPTDLPDNDTSWSYEFELSIILQDGSTLNRIFDVKPQVLPVIEKIRKSNLNNTIAQPILIEVDLRLPVIESAIGVAPWEDDEIIQVKITDQQHI